MFRLIDKSSGYLFSSHDLRVLMESRRAGLRKEVEDLEANRFLNTASADLARYLVDKYTLNAPVLRRDAWSVSEHETQIDVRHDRNRWITDRDQPFLVPGQCIEVEVPIDGDVELLYARSSTQSNMPPSAVIRDGSLFLTFEIPHDSPGRDIRQEADEMLGRIEQHLEWMRRDLSAFDQDLTNEAERTIAARRERIFANQGRIASLGIPLKSRPGAPRTYVLPDVRRKVVPSLPPASSTTYQLEPMLDMERYEQILVVMQNMTRVMEQSPSAFAAMREEDLRQHYLVQLNGQFEGAATAETFNVSGKTDILLRANGRNVFIAECKFWTGPKHYSETIDQLLGYTAWRDTKTAILVFNRATAMSTVLAGVDSETRRHQNFKRQVEWKHESGFRYVFHHAGDPNREFVITVLVFDVPGAVETPK